MPVTLKVLSVRNVVVLTELRTTGSWLGVARLTLSLTLLERLLQLVHPVLTLSFFFFKSSICYTVPDRSPWQTIYNK